MWQILADMPAAGSPGLGSLDRCNIRAKRSRQLPTAMSMVSPKILYRRSAYAITYIFTVPSHRNT